MQPVADIQPVGFDPSREPAAANDHIAGGDCVLVRDPGLPVLLTLGGEPNRVVTAEAARPPHPRQQVLQRLHDHAVDRVGIGRTPATQPCLPAGEDLAGLVHDWMVAVCEPRQQPGLRLGISPAMTTLADRLLPDALRQRIQPLLPPPGPPPVEGGTHDRQAGRLPTAAHPHDRDSERSSPSRCWAALGSATTGGSARPAIRNSPEAPHLSGSGMSSTRPPRSLAGNPASPSWSPL